MPKTKRASVEMEKRIASRGLSLEFPRKRIQTVADAARFIDAVGFCVLFPVKNVPLPSLYYAVSHRSNARWDKFAQLIWRWKNELPKKRRAFYGKFFKGRGTFLSLHSLAYLLAAQESAISPDGAEAFYAAGRVSRDALEVWRILAEHGPLPTLELRHACKMETQPGNKRFKRAILELQALLIVTHSGVEQETESWASSRFDLVSCVFPKQLAAAQSLSRETARAALAAKYRTLYPCASPAQAARLFGWTKAQALSALAL
jgi:hypothetical protein